MSPLAWSPKSSCRLHCVIVLLATFVGSMIVGCGDDTDTIRQIQARRQEKLQSESKQDHLAETFDLLSKLVSLNRKKADRQIIYHLNQWGETQSKALEPNVTDLLKTVSEILPEEKAADWIRGERFVSGDINHLRDCYLFRQVTEWIDSEANDDLLLKDWMKQQQETLTEDEADELRTAARFFDWTVRNVAFESEEIPGAKPPNPGLPFGMELSGAGYRQTDYEAIWRGTGDGLQRSGVFIQLCRQASIPAAILATQSSDTGKLTPWCVGVLIGKQIYLFHGGLGTFIPGPNQEGIATLADARRDAAVTRRLGIAGFDEFEAPVSKSDIQQSVALLNVMPEAISPRMKRLESGLTGARRMRTYVDVDAEAEDWDAATGIAGVRIWQVPLLAEIYAKKMAEQAELDPMFSFWHYAKWAILDGDDDSAKQLSRGRWQHLHGVFADSEEDSVEGARTIYMSQRAPEFEIKDLAIDVDLQKKYFRRELGLSTEQYRQQLQQIQLILRLGKRTATYWMSLVQFDDGRTETASNWLSKRVLADNQVSHWVPAAHYNLGRANELLGKTEEAIELYKTSGDPQEHGNRIRARLLAKSTEN